VELTSLGARLYAHCSALGKVYWLTVPKNSKRIIQTAGLPRFHRKTITDEEELNKLPPKSVSRVLCHDLEEILLTCVALPPIYNHRVRLIAAISMSIPAYRFRRSQTEFREGVMRAAKTISKCLGYYGSS
jgi:DNA-binding IclR family transcriptional regulator